MVQAKQPAAQTAVMESLLARWAKYRASEIDMTIAPNEDMMSPGEFNAEHYLAVGLSAVEVVSEAMVISGKMEFAKILDLPCGFGRVARHFVKFFPDSQIFASEVDKAKQSFTASQFGLSEFDAPADFLGEPPDRFDLIFVGSLLTHLNTELTTNALRYLIAALAENGLLIFTTHGRHATNRSRMALQLDALTGFLRDGFGYQGDPTYGTTFAAPSWYFRYLETCQDARVLAFKERGWAGLQDAVVVQKAPAWTQPRPLSCAQSERRGQVFLKDDDVVAGWLYDGDRDVAEVEVFAGERSVGIIQADQRSPRPKKLGYPNSGMCGFRVKLDTLDPAAPTLTFKARGGDYELEGSPIARPARASGGTS